MSKKIKIYFDNGEVIETDLLNYYPKSKYFIISNQTDCVQIKGFTKEDFKIFEYLYKIFHNKNNSIDPQRFDEENILLSNKIKSLTQGHKLFKIITDYNYSDELIKANRLFYPKEYNERSNYEDNLINRLFLDIYSNLVEVEYYTELKSSLSYFIYPEEKDISKTGLDLTILDKKLKAKDLIEENNFDTKVDFFWFNTEIDIYYKDGKKIVNAAYNKKYYKKQTKLSNILNNEMITSRFILIDKKDSNKNSSFPTLDKKDFLGKYRTKTSLRDNVFIFKAEGSFRSQGIIIFNKDQGFDLFKNSPDDGIVMKYITNPYLTPDGFKFHFRIYLAIYYNKGLIRFYLHDDYRIITAKKKYVNEDYQNREIHISTGENTEHRYIFPNDFNLTEEQINLINSNIRNKILKLTNKLTEVKNYKESDAAFEIFGIDLMLDQDFNPFVLEINKKVGYGRLGEIEGWDKYIEIFSKKYFDWILNSIVYPHFNLVKFPEPLNIIDTKDKSLDLINMSEIIPWIVELKWILVKNKKEIGIGEYHYGLIILKYFNEIIDSEEFIAMIKNKLEILSK